VDCVASGLVDQNQDLAWPNPASLEHNSARLRPAAGLAVISVRMPALRQPIAMQNNSSGDNRIRSKEGAVRVNREGGGGWPGGGESGHPSPPASDTASKTMRKANGSLAGFSMTVLTGIEISGLPSVLPAS